MKFGMQKKYIAQLVLLCGAVVISGCGGTVAFQGKQALSVTGTPPPPPPPPPAPPPRVEIRDNKIEIHEKIQFAVNKATILEASFGLLDDIVKVIKDNPYVKKVAIEGHASAEGDKKLNLKLSDERAKSVMKYLVDHGVEKERLTAKGFGSTKPIADNETEEGREKNRRVEFNIVEQDVTQKKVEIDPTTGKEKVLEEKKSTEKKEDVVAPADEADKKATDKKAADKKAADKKADKAEKKAADKKADEKKADEKKADEKKPAKPEMLKPPTTPGPSAK